MNGSRGKGVFVTWKRALLAIAAAATLALLVAWSGVINIGASSGHWQGTAVLLHWIMQSSTRTYAALGAPEDPVDDSGLVSAAGHFNGSCAICHGAPGVAPSPVMQAAVPVALPLSEAAPKWNDDELFRILKHGIKYSGMPAWPTLERDDEVKRMVAFVRRQPTMSVETYRALVGLDGGRGTATGQLIDPALETCEGCHGTDGRGRGQSDIPILGGQHAHYLESALREYAAGERDSAVMGHAASRLLPDEMQRLARHFAALPGLDADAPAAVAGPTPTELDALAARVVREGLPERDLPACLSCHEGDQRERYPVLSGQKPEYLAARLHHWRGEENVVDARKSQDTMPTIARRIPEPLIEPLARYWARRGGLEVELSAVEPVEAGE